MHRDFNAPLVPPRPADSSAATIAASALLLLADQELSILNITGSVYYTNEVIKVRLLASSFYGCGAHMRPCADAQREHEARVASRVAEPARERDCEQSCAEQPDRHRLWYALFPYLLCRTNQIIHNWALVCRRLLLHQGRQRACFPRTREMLMSALHLWTSRPVHDLTTHVTLWGRM